MMRRRASYRNYNAARKLSWPRRLRTWIEFRFFRLSIVADVMGIAVSDTDEASIRVEKVKAALEILKSLDARSLSRLNVYCSGVEIADRMVAGDVACFDQATQLVRLNREYLDDQTVTPEAVASMLVHESAHAWLEARGLEYLEGRRVRMELICMRYEQRLARRLGNEPLSRQIADQMSWLKDDPGYFSDAAFDRRRVHALRHSNALPQWLIKRAVRQYLRRRTAQAEQSAKARPKPE